MSSKLLVIINDRLSSLLDKGEIYSNYYNPGNFFREVHILSISEDNVDMNIFQSSVGSAKFVLHNIPIPRYIFYKSFGWRPSLLKKYISSHIDLISFVNPDLIRCYGNSLNAYIAIQYKQLFNTPVIISLHNNPINDLNTLNIRFTNNFKKKLLFYAHNNMEKYNLQRCNIAIAVYESIKQYATFMGASSVQLIYNTMNISNMIIKKNYNLNNPPQIISVGRLIPGKNIDNIILSMEQINAKLTVVGNGPLKNYLKNTALSLSSKCKVTFIESIPNNLLCSKLHEYDLFVTHSDYCGIPKAVMEPLTIGLPVVINKRISGDGVKEFEGDHIFKVDNTPDSYAKAINFLLLRKDERERLGKAAYQYAYQNWMPKKMENKIIQLYQTLLQG